MKKLTLPAIVCLLCILIVGCNTYSAMYSPAEVNVPILMFHDVKTFEVEGGTWSISAENFRGTLEFLLENGYTPISFEELVNYVDGEAEIPDKPVCITLDDGYYSNYKNVLPIITELNVPVTIFMTCKTVRQEGVMPSEDENILCKMSAEELRIMESSPLVHIQSHTYGLHGVNTSYSDSERDNALPLEGESKKAFKEIFARDCEAAEKVLADAGAEDYTVLSYPSGKYHKWTEEVLRERGYRVSLTVDNCNANTVVRGKPKSLYLLGRMNVNDETTEEQLLEYLEM